MENKKINSLLAVAILFGGNASYASTTSTITEPKIPKQLCIYYGGPSYVNGAENINKAVEEFSKCSLIVLGSGISFPNHEYHNDTLEMIKLLSAKNIPVYGYVDTGVMTDNLTIEQASTQVSQWKDMGVSGIFLDDFGFDYGTTRARQNQFLDLVHNKSMPAFVNAYNPPDVFSDKNEKNEIQPSRIQGNDIYLAENWLYEDGNSTNAELWYEKSNYLIENLSKYNVKLATTSTTKGTKAFATDISKPEFSRAYMGSVLQGADYYQWTDADFSSSNDKLVTYEEPSIIFDKGFTSDIIKTKTNDTVNGFSRKYGDKEYAIYSNPNYQPSVNDSNSPGITVSGFGQYFIGDNATIELSSSNPIIDQYVDFQYSLDKGATWINGKEITLTSSTAKTVSIKARSKLKSSPENNDKSWSYLSKNISFVVPKSNMISFSTNKEVAEIGNNLELTVKLTPSYKDIDPDLVTGTVTMANGQNFTLHNGINTIKIDSVSMDLVSKDIIPFTVETMLTPYEQTKTTKNYSIKYYEYKWPNFNAVIKQQQPTAPTLVTVSMVPDEYDFKYYTEISYNWITPEEIESVTTGGAVSVFKITKPGKYYLKLIISDKRGNETVKEITLEAFEEKPISLTVKPYYEKIMNEPAAAYFKISSVTGGRITDPIISYNWQFDGVAIPKSSSVFSINKIAKGTHEVSVTAKTKSNNSATSKLEFTVVENIAPECKITKTDSSKIYSIVASCTDKDGVISSYDWKDGETVISKRNYVSLSKSRKTEIKDLKLDVRDDSGYVKTFEVGPITIIDGIVK
jgi:hypothetical protein